MVSTTEADLYRGQLLPPPATTTSRPLCGQPLRFGVNKLHERDTTKVGRLKATETNTPKLGGA